MTATPPDDWFVVRGGIFAEPENVLQTITDALEDGFGATASVYAGYPEAGEQFDAAFKRICTLSQLPHRKVRVTTAGKLRAAGFDVVLDTSDGQPTCHHNVVFTEPPNMVQARLFIECFDSPIPNPAKE